MHGTTLAALPIQLDDKQLQLLQQHQQPLPLPPNLQHITLHAPLDAQVIVGC